MPYTITTSRLGLRNYQPKDLAPMIALNQNPQVMRYFPVQPTATETAAYIKRMQAHFEKANYCYFAVDRLDTQEFIGFIGLMYQDYEAFFTPCVDIGWRLTPSAWGKGYATEGAKACLDYAFNALNLEEIYAVAPVINKPSIAVMKKIGMKFLRTFKHPKLTNFPALEECVLYVKKTQKKT